MYTFLIVIALIISVLLILVVLVQNPKGGGLSSSFSSSNQVMGVKKTTDFLEKATWTLAIALLVVCLVINMVKPSAEEGTTEQSAVQEQIDNASTAPQAPTNMPANSTSAAPAAADTTK
jgi:preprotein translocase subunit SecG